MDQRDAASRLGCASSSALPVADATCQACEEELGLCPLGVDLYTNLMVFSHVPAASACRGSGDAVTLLSDYAIVRYDDPEAISVQYCIVTRTPATYYALALVAPLLLVFLCLCFCLARRRPLQGCWRFTPLVCADALGAHCIQRQYAWEDADKAGQEDEEAPPAPPPLLLLLPPLLRTAWAERGAGAKQVQAQSGKAGAEDDAAEFMCIRSEPPVGRASAEMTRRWQAALDGGRKAYRLCPYLDFVPAAQAAEEEAAQMHRWDPRPGVFWHARLLWATLRSVPRYLRQGAAQVPAAEDAPADSVWGDGGEAAHDHFMADLWFHMRNSHTLLSCFAVHPLHPLRPRFRIVLLIVQCFLAYFLCWALELSGVGDYAAADYSAGADWQIADALQRASGGTQFVLHQPAVAMLPLSLLAVAFNRPWLLLQDLLLSCACCGWGARLRGQLPDSTPLRDRYLRRFAPFFFCLLAVPITLALFLIAYALSISPVNTFCRALITIACQLFGIDILIIWLSFAECYRREAASLRGKLAGPAPPLGLDLHRLKQSAASPPPRRGGGRGAAARTALKSAEAPGPLLSPLDVRASLEGRRLALFWPQPEHPNHGWWCVREGEGLCS